mmetsp:Transcript_9341/g.26204  ORF Transcript_9341/g.26204 Transcript_9341/m.26204 type:complete len:174 (+) Transcript_9341:184-705(+)|eukprot:CAMPEP_0119120320 /NCGR_PEP_ID=MMETSP1310-20130426/1412_1 /TAXON_ID=464262 /ORGANISM="Genus nov. species nov., Strain RCC2339" /LENGTH=173 /DNA_ID=CAMNT_0007109791 /DNA_START=88 /DNA_END=609 /DNA_ORIENTATION=-
MGVQDLLVILCVSLTNAVIVEGISWLLIYNTESFIRTEESINRIQKNLDKKKAEKPTKASAKQVERLEENLKQSKQSMFFVTLKSKFAVTISLVLLFAILNSIFDGKVVARLPFEPFGIFHRVSHRSLLGEDYRESSFLFFYILCNMGLSANLKKFMGLSPKTVNSNPFAAPQ